LPVSDMGLKRNRKRQAQATSLSLPTNSLYSAIVPTLAGAKGQGIHPDEVTDFLRQDQITLSRSA